MTALTWPDHLLTIEEWDALPEDASRQFELVDGILQMSPRPTTSHQVAAKRLMAQLDAALAGSGLETVPEIDLVLVATFPPLVRAPDITVTTKERLRTRPGRLRPADVALVVEIISPGSARTDRIAKRADYAEAGIQNYWIVDLTDRPVIDVLALRGRAYETVVDRGTGRLTVPQPAEITIDLDALVP